MQLRSLRVLSPVASLALGLALLAPTTAHAQAQTAGGGVRFGVAATYLDGSDLGVGAFAKFHLFELNEKPITGRISFNYFFPGNNLTSWEINGDALYDIANPKSELKPYIGAGLNYYHYGVTGCGSFCSNYSNNGLGLNLLGGINFMANSRLMPYVEIGLKVHGGSGLYVQGGVHLH